MEQKIIGVRLTSDIVARIETVRLGLAKHNAQAKTADAVRELISRGLADIEKGYGIAQADAVRANAGECPRCKGDAVIVNADTEESTCRSGHRWSWAADAKPATSKRRAAK